MGNLLIYNIPDSGKLRKIQTLAVRLGFRVRVVKPEEYSLPLGALVNLPEAETWMPGDGTPFSDEMLVLCNVSPQAFQSFLSGLRTQKTPVALKAMLTQHNVSWSSSALHKAILEEHQAMQQGKQSPHQ